VKKFKHINATTIDEAVLALGGDKAKAIAGGTDLLSTMKNEILSTYPEVIVNLKTIPGLNYIKEEDGTLKIGALTSLADVVTGAGIIGAPTTDLTVSERIQPAPAML
jgi:CO/xanthine dehydrogenase FAD-binding subunit